MFFVSIVPRMGPSELAHTIGDPASLGIPTPPGFWDDLSTMTDDASLRVTHLLQRAREDRESALAELLPLVQEELHRIAQERMRHERGGHTLQPTALVHEAYLQLVQQDRLQWQDRAQFLAAAAHVMRQVLISHARRKNAQKRQAGRARVTLHEDLAEEGAPDVDLLDLDEKLGALKELSERRARVVELRFFGGLTFEEAGHVLGIAPKTVEADWYLAGAWLRREMRVDRGDPRAGSREGPERG